MLDSPCFDVPAHSFYQSAAYVDCLAAAAVEHHTSDTGAGLLVAARMQDGGLEIWEGPRRSADVVAAWLWLIERAHASRARYCRLVLPPGLRAPPALDLLRHDADRAASAAGMTSSADTIATALLATAPALDQAVDASFRGKARRAEKNGVRIDEAPFDSAWFAATYVALARERGFLGEVDDVAVLRRAAELGHLVILHARSSGGAVLGYTVLLIHDERLEVRYPWRSLDGPPGTMNALYVAAWQRARALGKPYLDLGGLPSAADLALDGVARFKLSSGAVRHERGAFRASFASSHGSPDP